VLPSILRLPVLVLAVFASFACSQGPAGRSPPLLDDGEGHPPIGSRGASGAATAATPGPSGLDDAGDDSRGDPVPACTALALCCNKFNTEDPAQAWCVQSLVQAQEPDQCEGFLVYWGC
jgi:hypothetical protein